MTKRGLLRVTHDTDVDGFALDTDDAEACLPGAQCWRGGWCPDDEDECCANESVVTQGVARRPLTTYVSTRSIDRRRVHHTVVTRRITSDTETPGRRGSHTYIDGRKS